MECSIVIVSYNVRDFLFDCIASIKDHSASVEIIVVDNNSSDGTIDMLGKNYPKVKTILNKANKGFSAANNQGIAIARSKNILLLNPDTVIVGDALEKMITFMDQQPGHCIVGPRILNSDGSLQISCWKFPGILEIFIDMVYLHTLFPSRNYSFHKMKNSFSVDAVSGAAMMFRRDVINKIGYLDEKLFWMEDVDFCFRAERAGVDVIYFPQAEIIHHSGKSSVKNLNIVVYNQLISKLKFEKKYGNSFNYFIANIFVFIHLVSRLIILFFAFPFGKRSRDKFFAYLFSLRKYFKFIFTGDETIV